MVAPNDEHALPPDRDPMGPPATPVEVECVHCGNIYMSDQIRWQPDPNGPDGGWWICPIEGCDGAGFCFDIFPTDPKVAEQFGVHTWECGESEFDESEEFDESDDEDDFDPPARNGGGIRDETSRSNADPGLGGRIMSEAQPAPRKRLKVDLADLAGTMDLHSDIGQSYLDLDSGEIHALDDDLLRRVEDDELGHLPDWEKPRVEVARAVLAESERYVEIPDIESGDSFEVMREFVAREVPDDPARRRLESAIAGPKPFRRFKDALLDFPDLRERWFAFEARAKETIAREWLDSIGVDVIEP